MPGKHIIFIHGRDTKPVHAEKLRLTRTCLAAGLRRVDARLADEFEDGSVRFTMAYYGDINSRILIADDPNLTQDMIRIGDSWYEPDGTYDDHVERLLGRLNRHHTRRDYQRLLGLEKNTWFASQIAKIASPVLSAIGLGRSLVSNVFPDLQAYLSSRALASEIQERLIVPLRAALLSGDDLMIVSHSMGCMVAYDVLWKFSRTSEYRELWDKRVPYWLTLGSPLGYDSVRENLFDANEPKDLRYPGNVDLWANVSAYDDYVAHIPEMKGPFREMLRCGCVGQIVDIPSIHNFYVGESGSNPHKLYGYLNHPVVARLIAAWMWH
jgi:hypothetical protein